MSRILFRFLYSLLIYSLYGCEGCGEESGEFVKSFPKHLNG